MKEQEIIIGYANTHHEAAIAHDLGGELFAEGIERSSQTKRNYNNVNLVSIAKAVKKSLKGLKIDMQDKPVVNFITTWNFRPSTKFRQQVIKFLLFICDTFIFNDKTKKSLHANIIYDFVKMSVFSQLRYEKQKNLLPIRFGEKIFEYKIKKTNIKSINHHLSHASFGVFSSPFKECLILVIDGTGEDSPGNLYYFNGKKFKKIREVSVPFGFLYSVVTILCGFDPIEGEEWKVMGLAPYGKFNQEIYDFFSETIKVKGLSASIQLSPSRYKKLEKIAGPFREEGEKDVLESAVLAHNFQLVFEEKLTEFIANIYDLGLSENLVLTGGCALNSSANGILHKKTKFSKIHIPSAPGDDGNSVGALFYAKFMKDKTFFSKRNDYLTPYLGSEVDVNALEKILSHKHLKYKKFSKPELTKYVAKELTKGRVIGWMQGRAEFGPRALGNRSIIADPRRAQMKNIINAKVKFRELYRPFAPSILEDHAESYFEDYYPSYYMERTLTFKPEVRKKIPAVVHVNGTGRLQTVRKDWNPLYYDLIKQFYKLTEVPVILNTSFNVMGKPIIHSIEDALTVFFGSGMDLLVIDSYVIYK